MNHFSILHIIKQHKVEFLKLGPLRVEMARDSKGKAQAIYLNDEQSMLLVTYYLADQPTAVDIAFELLAGFGWTATEDQNLMPDKVVQTIACS